MPVVQPYINEDAEAILEIYRPFIAESAVSFESEVPGLQEFEKRLENIASKFPLMVLKEDGRVIGYAYANTHRERLAYRWAVETSIYLAEGFKGRGLGQVLYQLLLNELVKRGFTHAFGIITLPNDASVRLHLVCGFLSLAVHEKAGWKLGKWHDVLWMRKALAEESPTPLEPNFAPWTGQVTL